MDSFDIVIDRSIIRSVFETSSAEVADLVNFKLLAYLFLLGVLPSLLIATTTISRSSFRRSVMGKLRDSFLSLVVLVLAILPFSKFYTSFFREHKPLRFYTNPTYFLYSTGKYFTEIVTKYDLTIVPLGVDARVVRQDIDGGSSNKLVILVVGEAARADHFSLNGYPRATNPLLKQEKGIVNFSQMYSCGTSTAYSLPCMFSLFPRSEYSEKKGLTHENVLDVLRHTGSIDILWRDNNSDSKGVALRVPNEDYKLPANNPVCTEGECRDEGMLVGLDRYIDERKNKDILIVLHQMGNHGPAYYKRYPKEFEVFKPTCATNQLENCSNEAIINSYDNALLYTDQFLSKAIQLLKNNETTHATALLYLSDHGESLGENHLYLHGMPYNFAPEAQKHIGAMMWFGDKMRKQLDIEKISAKKDEQYSHDNLFHTLLGIFDVQTKEYKKDMDMLYN
jgi:lipid A ethanolaminephosphotransferase